MAPAPEQRALTLLDLPDGALVSVLGKLSLQERHAAVPLVCRRLADLLLAPQLLADISVNTEQWRAVESRADGLLRWLRQRAAGHTRVLDVCLDTCYAGDSDNDSLQEALTATLAACGSAGDLQVLKASCVMNVPPRFTVGSWAESLGGLRALDLYSNGKLAVTAALGHLSSLQELSLIGEPLDISSKATLPAGLTALTLGTDNNGRVGPMPRQVSTLTALRRLKLDTLHYDDDTPLASLAQHRTLRQLEVARCGTWVPPSLGRLTCLQSLALVDWNACYQGDEGDPLEDLQEALPQLRQLTFLALSTLELLDAPPSAITALTNLRAFGWIEGYELETDDSYRLPSGDWLQGLRRLVVPQKLLARSRQALAPHRQLEVQAIDRKKATVRQVEDMLRWAAEAPAA